MKKNLIILLLTIPIVGFSQNNKLIDYLENYSGYFNHPDTVFLGSSHNVCDWLNNGMFLHDIKIYKDLSNDPNELERYDYPTTFRLILLDELLNKYFGILKHLMTSSDFEKLKNNQKIWLTYRDTNLNPSDMEIVYGFNSNILYMSFFKEELYQLRIKDLLCYINNNCNEFCSIPNDLKF